DLFHGLVETAAVFCLVDGIFVRADQLDVVLFQHAMFVQCQSTVERGLATHGGQNGIGTFAFDDLRHGFPSDGLDIGGVGHGRVGHDGGGVGVHQDDPVALFA